MHVVAVPVLSFKPSSLSQCPVRSFVRHYYWYFDWSNAIVAFVSKPQFSKVFRLFHQIVLFCFFVFFQEYQSKCILLLGGEMINVPG